MKSNKVLIEKCKGFEIYYDKNEDKFISDKEKLDIHFEARSLWEIKGRIKETRTEEVNKDYLIISGYFNKELALIKLLTINKSTKRCKYKIIESTRSKYDDGQIKEEFDVPKLYPYSKENIEIFNQVKELEKEIKKIEGKQNKLVSQLHKQKKVSK